MNEHSRYEIIAHAASMASRLNPGLHEEMIGKIVADTAISIISRGGNLHADLAGHIDEKIETMAIIADLLKVLSRHLGRDDFDVETRFDAKSISLRVVTSMTRDITDMFGMAPDEIDLFQASTIGDIIRQICDHNDDHNDTYPSASLVESELDKVAGDNNMASHGIILAPVPPEENSPGFIYSVGLSEKGKADLLFIGDCAPATYAYLGMFIEMQMNGNPIPYGLFPANHELNRFEIPIWISPADEKLSSHAYGAVSRLDEIGSDKDARLVQIIMPDKIGRFPWEPGYNWINQEAAKPMGTGIA